jgi:hypothetical protein
MSVYHRRIKQQKQLNKLVPISHHLSQQAKSSYLGWSLAATSVQIIQH